MNFSREFLELHYHKLEKSIREIADEFNSYPMEVIRSMKREGVRARTKSEAQTLNVKKGNHPTRGKSRRRLTKNKISESVAASWEDRRERTKVNPYIGKHAKKGGQALNKVSHNGSKLEHFLVEGLKERGFIVKQRYPFQWKTKDGKGAIVHIYLPAYHLAVLISGRPSLLPIFGKETVAKYTLRLNEVLAMLRKAKMKVIHLKCLSKHMTQAKNARSLESLIELVKDSYQWEAGCQQEMTV